LLAHGVYALAQGMLQPLQQSLRWTALPRRVISEQGNDKAGFVATQSGHQAQYVMI
jgi:hypothetical protein